MCGCVNVIVFVFVFVCLHFTMYMFAFLFPIQNLFEVHSKVDIYLISFYFSFLLEHVMFNIWHHSITILLICLSPNDIIKIIFILNTLEIRTEPSNFNIFFLRIFIKKKKLKWFFLSSFLYKVGHSNSIHRATP